jgi:hypothetical protein
VGILITGSSNISAAPRSQVRQVYAAIALKLAKAFAARLPCAKAPTLPAQAPALPPM